MAGAATVAVISDVHANLTAMTAVRARLDELWIDELIVLGDLLTYGAQVAETLDLIDELTVQYPTSFIRGNHDQLYFDLDSETDSYLETREEWVRSAARWTHERLEVPLLPRYDWQWEVSRGDVFFSHANPFGPEDWRYLKSDDDLVDAGARLRSMAARIGVFGHTHRPSITMISEGDELTPAGDEAQAEAGALIVNPGSVGFAPGGVASFAVLSAGGGENARIERVPYDLAAHLKVVRASDMDAASKRAIERALRSAR
jgi:predicted phosphodiesterase